MLMPHPLSPQCPTLPRSRRTPPVLPRLPHLSTLQSPFSASDRLPPESPPPPPLRGRCRRSRWPPCCCCYLCCCAQASAVEAETYAVLQIQIQARSSRCLEPRRKGIKKYKVDHQSNIRLLLKRGC